MVLSGSSAKKITTKVVTAAMKKSTGASEFRESGRHEMNRGREVPCPDDERRGLRIPGRTGRGSGQRRLPRRPRGRDRPLSRAPAGPAVVPGGRGRGREDGPGARAGEARRGPPDPPAVL